MYFRWNFLLYIQEFLFTKTPVYTGVFVYKNSLKLIALELLQPTQKTTVSIVVVG